MSYVIRVLATRQYLSFLPLISIMNIYLRELIGWGGSEYRFLLILLFTVMESG